MTVDVPSRRPRHWLITSPRSASNLLVRMLNLDEQHVRPALRGGYFFFQNALGRLTLYAKPAQEWTPEDFAELTKAAKGCFNDLQDHVEAAEAADEGVFVKEHASFLTSVYSEAEYLRGAAVVQNTESENSVLPMRGLDHATHSTLNRTCLPDEFLKTWHPAFLIRHPAMMLPSLYRAAHQQKQVTNRRLKSEPYDIEASPWSFRALYDFYLDHFGKDSQWPIVLDADDVMTQPGVVIKYAELVGLDPNKLRFSWDEVSKEELDKMLIMDRIMLSSINSSTGVDKGKIAGDIDIDAEAVKWRAEFGEEGGKRVERWVREAMPNYEYLHSRRLRI
ncbi:hypothetical protein GGS21DRAFT_547127 [Xylaria nigripes]|nr:hypothetical protein GGS21DRAFT_547127 [Xylaria nigripes]